MSADLEFWKQTIREFTYPALAGMLFLAFWACVLAYFQLGKRGHWLPLAGMFVCMFIVICVATLITGVNPVFPRQALEHFAVFSWAAMLIFIVWFLVAMGIRLWGEGRE